MVRERMVNEIFNHVAHDLAVRCAEGVGVEPPKEFAGKKSDKKAPEVSIYHRMRKDTVETFRVAILAADGYDHAQLDAMKQALMDAGAMPEVVSKFKGTLKGKGNSGEVEVDKSHVTTASIMYDAVFVPGGQKSIEAQKKQADALHFVQEAFKHAKTVGALGEGVDLLREARLPGVSLADGDGVQNDHGVVTAGAGASHDAFASAFIGALAEYRHFARGTRDMVPA